MERQTPEGFIHNQDLQRNVRIRLVLGCTETPVDIEMLRGPLQRASSFVEMALQVSMAESHTGKLRLELDGVPDSVWIRILRFINGQRDLSGWRLPLDETVPVFAVIDYLQPKSDTVEGQNLTRVAGECASVVRRYREGNRAGYFMAQALEFGVEEYMYNSDTEPSTFLYGTSPNPPQESDCYATLLDTVRKRLDAGHLPPKPFEMKPLPVERILRAYPPAQVSLFHGEEELTIIGCGYAMGCASKVWRDALPNIHLSAIFPIATWDKVLRIVHRVGDPNTWGPNIHDATDLDGAITSIEPDPDDPTGRVLQSITEQCRTLLRVKVSVVAFDSARKSGRQDLIAKAAQELSRRDRMLVAWLDSAMLRALLDSEPWKAGQVSPYELIVDWANYHGADLLRREGLADIVDWSHCPSALREEAIAAEVLEPSLPIPSNLRFDKMVTFQPFLGDDSDSEFLQDGGQLIACAKGMLVRWDARTVSLINHFNTPDRLAAGSILTHNMVACLHQDPMMGPVLRSLKDGTVVAQLRRGEYWQPVVPRTQAYRYVISQRDEQGRFTNIHVWGRRGFKDDYDYLHDIKLCYRCLAAARLGNSLLTCGCEVTKDDVKWMVEERNLDKNVLVNRWTTKLPKEKSNKEEMEPDTEESFDSVRLFVTHGFIVLTIDRPGEMLVYDRNASKELPRRLGHEGAHDYAVSGYHIISLAINGFYIWDLRSGDVPRFINNPGYLEPDPDGEPSVVVVWPRSEESFWDEVAVDGHIVVVKDMKGRLWLWNP